MLICTCALAGALVGFLAGLIPGLHMNNIAALLSAYAGVSVGLFSGVSDILGSESPGLAISSFLSAALIAHTISESIPSTYMGIPSGDTVSVLPAHRLARCGLGRSAVRASADGAFAGTLAAAIALIPMSFLMGAPINFYDMLRMSMGAIVVLFSCILLFSEAFRTIGRRKEKAMRVLRGALIFFASGLLGWIVLKTDFYASPLPDLPWGQHGFVPREALLLPLFAGLFGVPSLLLSLGSRQVWDIRPGSPCVDIHSPNRKDIVLSLLGGAIVGWMPGMTSGSAATLCMPAARETVRASDIPSSLRFIWLYSSISGAGGVFALGALFTIARTRSGTMDSIEMFLGSGLENSVWPSNLALMLELATAMLFSAVFSHSVLRLLDRRIRVVRNLMGSNAVTVAALTFILSLAFALTGLRGAVVTASSVSLGLLTPLLGVRRIQLMGCLLVPIAASFLG